MDKMVELNIGPSGQSLARDTWRVWLDRERVASRPDITVGTEDRVPSLELQRLTRNDSVACGCYFASSAIAAGRNAKRPT